MSSRIPEILLLALLPCFVSAESATLPPPDVPMTDLQPQNPHWTSSFQFENDIFANTDCYYTNGVKLSWVSPDLTEYRDAGYIPSYFYKISDYLPFIHEKAVQRNVAINFGQNMYAPMDITRKDPDPKDRPYCGWLYVGFAFHNQTERWLDIMELNVGVTGAWSGAEWTQKTVHRLKKCDIPQGWSHQIGNEVVVNFVWERKVRFWRLGDAEGPAADAFVHLGGSLGTLYTYANTGFTVRCGWNLPTDFGSSPIRIAGDVNAPAAPDDPRLRAGHRWGIHFFGDFDQRAVARDATLDGNLFGDSNVSVHKKPYVTDVSCGVSLITGNWKISYAQVARSKEFDGQVDSWHVFGSVSVSYTY